MHCEDIQDGITKIFIAPILSYPSFPTILFLPHYQPSLNIQTFKIQRAVFETILECIMNKGVKISTREDVESIFNLMEFIFAQDKRSTIINSQISDLTSPADLEIFETQEEQERLAYIVHYFSSDNPHVQLEILEICQKRLETTNSCITIPFTSVINNGLRLARKFFFLNNHEECKKTFLFIHSLIHTCNVRANKGEAFRWYVYAAEIADRCNMGDIAYDLFAEAFSIYEDTITDSKVQFESLAIIINALHRTRNLNSENLDTLSIKAIKHGPKLLQKPAQCRVVYLASHLWWALENPFRTEYEEKKLIYDGQRVLECLEKALKIANTCMDIFTKVELYIEILSRYAYYNAKGNKFIDSKNILTIRDLVSSNINLLDRDSESSQSLSSLSFVSIYEPSSTATIYVQEHAQRVLRSLKV